MGTVRNLVSRTSRTVIVLVPCLALMAQDLYFVRLQHAGGWLAAGTWLQVAVQILVAAGFGAAYLILPPDSFWLLVPAALHGGLMAAWFLRGPLRKWIARTIPVSHIRA